MAKTGKRYREIMSPHNKNFHEIEFFKYFYNKLREVERRELKRGKLNFMVI